MYFELVIFVYFQTFLHVFAILDKTYSVLFKIIQKLFRHQNEKYAFCLHL